MLLADDSLGLGLPGDLGGGGFGIGDDTTDGNGTGTGGGGLNMSSVENAFGQLQQRIERLGEEKVTFMLLNLLFSR